MNLGLLATRKLRLLALAAFAYSPFSMAVVELDLAPFRAATCADLQGEYRAILDVNRAVLEEMRRTDKEPGGSNLLGSVSFASVGAGSYNAEEAHGPETALIELDAYKAALVRVAGEKKCALPGSGPGPEAKRG